MEEIPAGGPLSPLVVARFVDLATDALGAAREEIDDLNVYPVPDGDTGTNMFLTISAAREALHAAEPLGSGRTDADAGPTDIVRLLRAFSRGALLGARGNSGVILSEMLRAVAAEIADAARQEPVPTNARIMADALAAATTASYAAVGEPVEGTILTVARAASEAAVARADRGDARARDVFADAAHAARVALARTPEQLPVLARAGVVDAGGRGLCVVLDAAETALTGSRPEPLPSRSRPETSGATDPSQAADAAASTDDLTAEGPAYEVMYLLDAEAESVTRLRGRLAELGDSLVVVGGPDLWHVHVHVDAVGPALEAGIEAGRPHRIEVTHFAEQIARGRRRRAAAQGRGVVAVAAGPGLHAIFAESGAVVVDGGPGDRPAAGAIMEAILATGAAEVVVLPNDEDSVRAAEIAAQTAMAEATDDLEVAVIATHAQVQGLAALAVHDPDRNFERDVREMTATARHVRHGAVTVAAKQAMTAAGPCEPGDVLGAIEGDFVAIGDDLAAVARDIVGRLVSGGGELVTLVAGADDDGLTEALADWMETQHPLVEVVTYDGGQRRYPLLMSVE